RKWGDCIRIEVRTARLRVVLTKRITSGRQNGRSRGRIIDDWEGAGKFGNGQIATWRDLDGQIAELIVPGVEERLDRHIRMVVEGNGEGVGGKDEGDLRVGDR